MKNYLQHLYPRHSLAFFQPTLFRMALGEFVINAGVSLNEMKRWNEKGWLSFDPSLIDDFDERERMEVAFIKALAHSGLSYAMIDNLLSGLKKPYCYDPEETFFSFAKGSWVTLPRDLDRDEESEKGIDALTRNVIWDELEYDLHNHRGGHDTSN